MFDNKLKCCVLTGLIMENWSFVSFFLYYCLLHCVKSKSYSGKETASVQQYCVLYPFIRFGDGYLKDH